MISDAIRVESTAKDVALNLEILLFEYWIKHKFSLSSVFLVLELDKSPNMLAHPAYHIWITYANYCTSLHPEDSISAVKSLANLLGPDVLMQKLIAAQKDPYTKVYAAFMRRLLLTGLLAEKSDLSVLFGFARAAKNYDGYGNFEAQLFDILNEKQFAISEVFSRLGLREAPNIFASPAFLTWTNFVDNWNKMHPGKHVSAATALVKVLGEDGLKKVIPDAIKDQLTRSDASSVRDQVIDVLLDSGVKPDFVIVMMMREGIHNAEFVTCFSEKYDMKMSKKRKAATSTLANSREKSKSGYQ